MAAATNEQVPAELTAELVHSVFSNRVITTNILSHLNFTDLKSCRGVSRTFLETIEAYEPFKKSQLLVISEDKFALGDLEPDLLQDWNLKQHIRNIRINVYDVEEELFHIPNAILNNVTFVSLLSKDLEDFDYTEPGPFRIIRRILSSARQMSHLQLDLRLLMVSLRQVFDSSDAIDENLKDLKHLDILGWTQRFRSTTYCIADENDDDDLLHFLSFFETNFVQLLSSLQSLETLHLPRFTFSQRQELEIQSAVVRLLQRNRESLRELSLHLGIWNGVLPVTLPRLRSLSATVSNRAQQDSLKDFLANANKDCLEELGVVVRTHEDYQFGKNLFDVIRQRSPTLKKLHLQAFKFVDEEGNAMSKVDWTFLGGMKYLRDFQLTRPRCVEPNLKSYGNGTILLESLPRNQLERLGLRGIGFNSFGFWRTDVNDKEPELPFKLNLLRGFRSLRRLSLCYCCDALDDDIVRFIVEEMTSLEELELSHCSRLTDRGIAGTSEDGSDSIRNLKHLKVLSLRSCPLVTPAGILSCLHFPLLQSFDYIAAQKVRSSFVARILSQNPSLKSLAVNFEECEEEVIRKNCSKLRPAVKLRNLSDRDWECGNDSDSDAEPSDMEDSEEGDDDDDDDEEV